MTNHGLLVLESLSQLEAKLFRNSGRCLFIVDTTGCGGSHMGFQERLRRAGETEERRGAHLDTCQHPAGGKLQSELLRTYIYYIIYYIIYHMENSIMFQIENK